MRKEPFKVKVELRQHLESVSEGEAELIFFIPDGVQLFIIEVHLS